MIAVKGNQPNLYRQIQRHTADAQPTSRHISRERTRNRVTTRIIEVFQNVPPISSSWIGLKSLLKVERFGTRAGKSYHQVAYYISSLLYCAADFAPGIRGHWGIENRLHWVKDVVFAEDNSAIRQGNAPANCSVIFAIALNVLRRHGYSSITRAQRFLAHDLDKLFLLLE